MGPATDADHGPLRSRRTAGRGPVSCRTGLTRFHPVQEQSDVVPAKDCDSPTRPCRGWARTSSSRRTIPSATRATSSSPATSPNTGRGATATPAWESDRVDGDPPRGPTRGTITKPARRVCLGV